MESSVVMKGDIPITEDDYVRLHACAGGVALNAEGTIAVSVKVVRSGKYNNRETANSVDYCKSPSPKHNEGLRETMRRGLMIRVCAEHRKPHDTRKFFDRGLFLVVREDESTFRLEKHVLVIESSSSDGDLEESADEIFSDAASGAQAAVLDAMNIPLPTPAAASTVSVAEPPAKRARLYGGPITTYLHGNRFRSRNEARLATFLKALNVDYEYEKTTFAMANGSRYTPDFYLPAQRLWIEFKPQYPHLEEMAKVSELCRRGYNVVLMYGDVFVPPFGVETATGGAFGRAYAHGSAIRGMMWDGHGKRIAGEGAFVWINGDVDIIACKSALEMSAATQPSALVAAYNAARTAQFE
jgi:hypothetical protein